MSARKLLAGLVVLVVLAHPGARAVAALVTADVILFALICAGIGWLLAATRHTWWRPRACPVPAARIGGAP